MRLRAKCLPEDRGVAITLEADPVGDGCHIADNSEVEVSLWDVATRRIGAT
jgi:hypothetical protein